MMDLSDGLERDAPRMARASGVDFDLSAAALAPFAEALAPAASVLAGDPLRWVLQGGEDFALLATFPGTSPLPEGFVAIGATTAGDGAVTLDGSPVEDGGWDHFLPTPRPS